MIGLCSRIKGKTDRSKNRMQSPPLSENIKYVHSKQGRSLCSLACLNCSCGQRRGHPRREMPFPPSNSSRRVQEMQDPLVPHVRVRNAARHDPQYHEKARQSNLVQVQRGSRHVSRHPGNVLAGSEQDEEYGWCLLCVRWKRRHIQRDDTIQMGYWIYLSTQE